MVSACLQKLDALGYGITLKAKALPMERLVVVQGCGVTGWLCLFTFLGPIVEQLSLPLVQATFFNSNFGSNKGNSLVHPCIIFCLFSSLGFWHRRDVIFTWHIFKPKSYSSLLFLQRIPKC